MKMCTDLDQSRILGQFLPLKSADMRIGNYVGKSGKVDGTNVHYYTEDESFGAPEIIYAWSLTALLSIIPYPSLHETFAGWRCDSYDKEGAACKLGEFADNPIDACYEMIVLLKEDGEL